MKSKPATAAPPGLAKTTPNHASDVDALAGRARQTIELDGKEFTIRPMKVKQFFPFLAIARPMLSALSRRPTSPPASLPSPEEAEGQGGSTTIQDQVEQGLADAEFMLDALEQHGPMAIQALSLGTEIPVAEIEELPLGDLVGLIKQFVVVNADFFMARGLSLPAGMFPTSQPADAPPAPPAQT